MTSDRPAAWDVVVVPFPYSERLAENRRPALVVSDEALHRGGHVWLVMITGAGKETQTGDVEVQDLASAGLPGASIIRTRKIATVEPDRVLRRVGMLAPGERAEVRRAIDRFLAT